MSEFESSRKADIERGPGKVSEGKWGGRRKWGGRATRSQSSPTTGESAGEGESLTRKNPGQQCCSDTFIKANGMSWSQSHSQEEPCVDETLGLGATGGVLP